jgi:hypothetical protein
MKSIFTAVAASVVLLVADGDDDDHLRYLESIECE